MQHDPDAPRPLAASGTPGKHTRVHLHAFGRQVLFILVCSLSTLLFDKHRPEMCLSLMRAMFGFSTLFLFAVALLTRQRASGAIGMWDHAIAMLILTLVSSVALQFLHKF